MRGVYVAGNAATIAAAVTILQVKAGATSALEVLRAWCTTYGVDTDDRMRLQLLRKSAAATVTSLTPVLMDPSDQAAKAVGGTAATGHTATAEGTDTDILIDEGASVLAGWTWLPTPEERILVPAGGIIAMKSALTVTSTAAAYGIIFRELG